MNANNMIERTKSAEEVRKGLHVKGIWIGFISPGWASGRGSPDCLVTCVHHDHDHQQPENMRDIRWTYGSRDSGHVAKCQRSKGVEKSQRKGSAVPRGRDRAGEDEQNVQEKDEDSSCRA
jgi:hypothetical protein